MFFNKEFRIFDEKTTGKFFRKLNFQSQKFNTRTEIDDFVGNGKKYIFMRK